MSEYYRCPACAKIGMRIIEARPINAKGAMWRSRSDDQNPPYGYDRIRRRRQCDCGNEVITVETSSEDLNPRNYEIFRLYKNLPDSIREVVLSTVRSLSTIAHKRYLVIKDGLPMILTDEAEALKLADQMPGKIPVFIEGHVHRHPMMNGVLND